MVNQTEKIEVLREAKRCLIVAPSWVGDMVMAQSLFREIKRIAPDLAIDVLAPEWCATLTEFMPEIDKIVSAPFKHGKLGLGVRRELGKSLKGQYDVAFVLPNSLKSALVPWFAKIPNRIGYIGEQRYLLLNRHQRLDKQALPTMCQRFVALAKPEIEIPDVTDILPPKFKVSAASQSRVVSQFGLSLEEQKVVALFPGAEFGPAKQWPVEHYAAVSRYFIDAGAQVWLFGSQKDVETCGKINTDSNNKCRNFAGETSLSEAVELISLIDLAISNDSGLMHIAAALNKPLVSIYGSTDPGFTPPMHKKSEIVRLGLECSPCFKRECPLEHLDCLNKLRPQRVLEAAQRLI